MTQTSKTIYQKLLEVQKEIESIKKDSKNPFFKSNYFDINALLEEVKPVLNKHGLIVMQPIQNNDLGNVLETIIIDSFDGEKITSSVSLPDNPDPQKTGSIITYFRRYALQSMLGLQAEDDDGNKGSETKKDFNPDKVLEQLEDQNAPICECGKAMKLSKSGKWYCKHDIDGVLSWGKPKVFEKSMNENEKKFMKDLDPSAYM
jgi:hypothetical protein